MSCKPRGAESDIAEGDELIDMYFKMRQEIRTDWENSGRASSLGLLSLDRTSLISHDDLKKMGSTFCTSTPSQSSKTSQNSTFTTENKENFDALFKRPKTPMKKDSLSLGMDVLAAALAEAEHVASMVRPVNVPLQEYLASSGCPETPRPFVDGLNSLLPDATPSLQNPHVRESLIDFPVRDQADVINLLKHDEKKFVPNTSGFSHNSEFANFSHSTVDNRDLTVGRRFSEMSLGQYFGKRSDSINSIIQTNGSNSNSTVVLDKDHSALSPRQDPVDVALAAAAVAIDIAPETPTNAIQQPSIRASVAVESIKKKTNAGVVSAASTTVASDRGTSTITMSTLQQLLGDSGMSASAICDQILGRKEVAAPVVESTPMLPKRQWDQKVRSPLKALIPKPASSEISTGNTSVKSGRSTSSHNSGGSSGSAGSSVLGVKLKSADRALSWGPTPLLTSSVQEIKFKVEALDRANTTPVTVRISVVNTSSAFKIINEKNEALSKVRKVMRPGVKLSLMVSFKPESVGLFQGCLEFLIDGAANPTIMDLTGLGGCPKTRIEGTLMDIYGQRMVTLVRPGGSDRHFQERLTGELGLYGDSGLADHQEPRDNSVLTAQFTVMNTGNVPAFVSISVTPCVLSLAHSVVVSPLQAVIGPRGKVLISLSQSVTRAELRHILSSVDIRVLARLSLCMGDEISRQRLRRHLQINEASSQMTETFLSKLPGESTLDLKELVESRDFEGIFRKSLDVCDISVVVEKNPSEDESTIIDLEDLSLTYASLSETVIPRHNGASSVDGRKRAASSYSASSREPTNKVEDWLLKQK